MSLAPAPPRRHALGLPAGSVRAVHVLGLVGLVCTIILVPPKDPANPVPIPPYLVYLLFLMIGHYFAAHGVSIATRSDPAPSPLFLPGGTVRLFVIVALVGCVGWKLYSDQDGLTRQFERSLDEVKLLPSLPLLILACFLLGTVVRSMIGKANPSAGLQDFEAWISLIALLAIAAAGIIHVIINPSLPVDQRLQLPNWEGAVGGVIAFYFGERS